MQWRTDKHVWILCHKWIQLDRPNLASSSLTKDWRKRWFSGIIWGNERSLILPYFLQLLIRECRRENEILVPESITSFHLKSIEIADEKNMRMHSGSERTFPNCLAIIQLRVGPRSAPATGFSANPARKRSISAGCAKWKRSLVKSTPSRNWNQWWRGSWD